MYMEQFWIFFCSLLHFQVQHVRIGRLLNLYAEFRSCLLPTIAAAQIGILSTGDRLMLMLLAPVLCNGMVSILSTLVNTIHINHNVNVLHSVWKKKTFLCSFNFQLIYYNAL